LEDLGLDGRMMLEWILKKQGVIVGWIHLAHDRDHLRAHVNTVMNIRVVSKAGNFLIG